MQTNFSVFRERILKVITLVISVVLRPFLCHSQTFIQDGERFRKAISTDSSSPYFVYITIIVNRTGETRSSCIEAPFLLSALHYEMNLSYDRFSQKQATEAALSNADHIFRFSKQQALDNLRVKYTQTDLDQAREMIRTFGVAPLMTLHSEKRKDFGEMLWSPALACALIERGLSARITDLSRQI